MKLQFKSVLAFLLIICLLPAAASAASIKLGGKVGFMFEGASVALTPKLKGVSGSELTWESSDEDVAMVWNGTIEAKSVGRAVISVSGGGAGAKCGVVVLPKTVEIREGESYSLPYGTVEKYKTYDKSVANISKKGLITAVGEGETKIRVSHGSQKLYVQVKVAGEDEPMAEQSRAARLDCADETSQIVLVEHEGGSRATLSIHEKKGGVWKELYSCDADLGKNGIGKTREGDNKTPTGTYNLTQPFGNKADPGANMPYTEVTKYHYWCGTSGSEYYNQLIDMRETDRKYTSSDEYLINYGSVYNYCLFIDYNADGEAGKGSCIFLHCSGSKSYTAGCIAVDEAVMKKIIQWVEPGAKIVIE
ncbi:MAG: L,D-transpeptidase family protein [Clostridia bacterium]|nr:L,D-transpeptidase family protein [Clostridia bacterium]